MWAATAALEQFRQCRYFRIFRARLNHSEKTVPVPVETKAANDRSYDSCRITEHNLLQVRVNAAPAIAAIAQGRFVPRHVSSCTVQRKVSLRSGVGDHFERLLW